MQPYIVRQGDYLLKIAMRIPCPVKAIWDAPENAELRRARDPNLLYPGDVLWVPQPQRRWLPVTTASTTRLTTTVPSTPLRLVFGDPDAPWAGNACVVSGLGGDDLQRTTDSEGALTLEAPAHVDVVTVRFPDADASFFVFVGHMDPIDTPTGALKRLHNLGYCDIASAQADPDSALCMAVAAFQEDQDIGITGELDDDTRAALLEAHGS